MPGPFDPNDAAAYGAWRERKLADHPRRLEELIVEVGDPRDLTAAERAALAGRVARCNMAIYAGRTRDDADKEIVTILGRTFGLNRLDHNTLARLLTVEPDLLLLDEPTNHLDLEALLWFQDYLNSYPGAIFTISHDREYLNQLVGSIVEIRQSKLIRYKGNYDDYLPQREAYEQQLLAAYKHQEREIARLMEFVNRFRAKNTKATRGSIQAESD